MSLMNSRFWLTWLSRRVHSGSTQGYLTVMCILSTPLTTQGNGGFDLWDLLTLLNPPPKPKSNDVAF